MSSSSGLKTGVLPLSVGSSSRGPPPYVAGNSQAIKSEGAFPTPGRGQGVPTPGSGPIAGVPPTSVYAPQPGLYL